MGHASSGRFTEALDGHAEKACALAPWDRIPAGLLAGLLVRTGGDANRVRGLLDKLDGQAYGAPVALALFYLTCGELDQAAKWFEKSIEERYPGTLYFITSPLGKSFRASNRWPALAKMMNLPSVSTA